MPTQIVENKSGKIGLFLLILGMIFIFLGDLWYYSILFISAAILIGFTKNAWEVAGWVTEKLRLK